MKNFILMKNHLLGIFLLSFLLLNSCGETKVKDEKGTENETKSCCEKDKCVSKADFKEMTADLLKEWCDGMVAVQINDPSQPTIHGALGCPACDKIHGRCMDAVYPLLYMADKTGDKKYLDAGIMVMEWADNVTTPEGAWTVIPNPKSWKGISVFGAIALAEALHYHGDVLDKERRDRWTKRLAKAGDYIYKNFDLEFTNINYGYTAIHALNLLGRVLDNPEFTARSKELAKGIPNYLTKENSLLYGEGKPSSKLSAKGLHPVDLGYNVEESLMGVVMYALHEKDEELLKILTKSLESHIEFMLPDGALDNSWGTRQAKWSYWGSRTTDGCAAGLSMMADRNPAFGTAAIRSLQLLKSCTADGLLHGGPHYTTHGVKPCVHHTFAHAKVLAQILDGEEHLPEINDSTPLPRSIADGVKTFPEIDTWLLARGPWRGTVTSYDFIYKEHIQQATGGAMSVLYHKDAGILFAASMAKYIMVEVNNCQPNPGEDFAFTPRIETTEDTTWYTNLYDLDAKVAFTDIDSLIKFDVVAKLKNEAFNTPSNTASQFNIIYECDKDKIVFKAKNASGQKITRPTALVLPVISPTGEEVKQISPEHIEIIKKGRKVVLKANTPLKIKPTDKGRVFNMVPGAEAVPIMAYFSENAEKEIIVTITVE